ncbi:MAG: YadA-like family protein [Veillonellaceae bacterium]|nr:YadA-like family protein [Veillonellaceae bacterium]
MGQQSQANGDNSTTLSGGKTADDAENAMAVGVGANATLADSVALGSYALANVAKGQKGYLAGGDTSVTFVSTGNAIAIGGGTDGNGTVITRQITGLAAGTNNTDAVNVGQLKKALAGVGGSGGTTYTAGKNITISGTEISAKDTTLDEASTGLTLEGKKLKLSVKDTDGKEITKTVDLSGLAGGSGSTVQFFSVNSTAGGNKNNDGATGEDAIAIGSFTQATGNSAVALGVNSTAAAGSAIAIGAYTMANGEGAVTIGSFSNATNVGATAFGYLAQAKGKNSVALGKSAQTTVDSGVALGSLSVANTATGVHGYDPSTKAVSTDDTHVWKSTLGAVSVGDTSQKYSRQITGVAAGTADTDAVNVAQLKKAMESAGGSGTDTTLDKTSTGLTLEGKTLKLSVKDTAGNEITKSVDLSGVAGGGAADGNDTLVSTSDALSIKEGKLNLSFADTAGNTVTGSVKLSDLAAGADTRNTVKAGDNVAVKEDKNADGSSTYTVSVKADGKVESGNKDIVTGSAVYNETRVAQDGYYVKAANTAGQNFMALDNQMNSLNGRIHDLDDRINHVGAGAAALAALHPQDYDPAAKLDFAAGYGHYNGANAVAIGAFYRPNNTTMFSIGGSMGGGENMVNVGMSFKIGKSGAYTGYSKAAMATVIEEQNNMIAQQQAQIEDILRQLEEMKK